jgi:hypothetical protein
MPFDGLHWFFDHAETISDRNIDRIAALGGGIAVQHRMAFQGEYFIERYGAKAAEATPPIGKMLKAGDPGRRRHRRHPRGQLQSVGLAELAGDRQDGGRHAALSAGQPPRPRGGPAPVDHGQHLVLQRGRQEGPDRRRPAGRPRGAGGRLHDRARGRDPAPVVGADPAGRQGGPRPGRLRQAGPVLPPPMPDWSPVRTFGGYQDRSRGHARALASRLRLRQRLQRPRPRPRRRLGARRRPAMRAPSGAPWAAAAGRYDLDWRPAGHVARLALVSAYLLGAIVKASDFPGAVAEQAHFGMSRPPSGPR